MNENTVILTGIMFVLGSIMYQIQIRLKDSKENILRIMKFYSGRANSLSLYEAVHLMRKRLKTNLDANERKEYKVCLHQYDLMNALLRFFGIYIPTSAIIMFVLTKK